MSNVDQFADSIIAEEGLDGSNSNQEQNDENNTPPEDNQDEQQADSATNDQGAENETDGDQSGDVDGDNGDDSEGDDTDGEPTDEDKQPTDSQDDNEEPREPTDTATRTVNNSRSLLNELYQKGMNPVDDQGNIRSFEDVVPADRFLASQLEPVRVTDKDGKTHEFLLLSDVEKAFPDGFEAKNNLEQMKFERAIQKNEDAFDKAIEHYKGLEQRYAQEVEQVTSARQSQDAIRQEYLAMAKEGLVPQVGDPKDPRFGESDAVKELNKILEYQAKENARRKEKGLGQLTTLYDTKIAMDNDPKVVQKKERAKKIDQQRKSTASLSRSPASKGNDDKKPKQYSSNMATFAEQIIAEEGL